MNRWKFLAIYIPSALVCYGIGHLAGVRDGTGTSAAIGWGGGLVVALAALAMWARRGDSWKAGVRVERHRADAANIRVQDPAVYHQILATAATDDPRIARVVQDDPDAFVALFLAAAADEGGPSPVGQPEMRQAHGPAIDSRAETRPQNRPSNGNVHHGKSTTRQEVTMEFQHAAQEDCYLQIQRWLTQLYGESVEATAEEPSFFAPIGRGGVMVGVQAFGDDSATVDLWTWPFGTRDTFSDSAYREMLVKNAVYRFGALNIQPNGSVIFEYQVVYAGLTKDLLSELISLVSASSDQIGVDLGASFGPA